MWWALGAIVQGADEGGSGKGLVDLAILGAYAAIAGVVIFTWARWMIRQRRGVVAWGEDSLRFRASNATPLRGPARPAAAEHDERERAAG